MDPLIVLFGLGVGVLVGLTGIGGGSIVTPLLILVVGTKPIVAIGTDLAYGAITKTLGGWRHLRKGTVDLGLSLWLAVGSAPGALAGVILIESIPHGEGFDDGLLLGLGVALMLVAIAVLVRPLFLPGGRERESVTMDRRMKIVTVVMGFLLGAVLGVTSVGSGSLIGLALIVVFRLTPHRVVGTDVFHAAILLWVAALGHLAFGIVDFGLMLNILVGSLPGVWIGTNLLPRMPTIGLRITLGAVLFASAFGMLQKAGMDVGLGVVLGVPVALGGVAFAIHRLRPPAQAQAQARAEASTSTS
jgi:uncharacterized membrane protein YfcA